MAEPGSRKPTVEFEPCWDIMCPVVYCSANPGCPCMNEKGFFALYTHKLRRERYETPAREGGPGIWDRRPGVRKSSDFDHDIDNSITRNDWEEE